MHLLNDYTQNFDQNRILCSLLDYLSIEPLPRSVERASNKATDLFCPFCSTNQPTHFCSTGSGRASFKYPLSLLLRPSNQHQTIQTLNYPYTTHLYRPSLMYETKHVLLNVQSYIIHMNINACFNIFLIFLIVYFLILTLKTQKQNLRCQGNIIFLLLHNRINCLCLKKTFRFLLFYYFFKSYFLIKLQNNDIVTHFFNE